MMTPIQVNDKLLYEGWIEAEGHAGLVVVAGEVFDDTNAAFDLCENGDVKLRGSLVWLHGYAVESTPEKGC